MKVAIFTGSPRKNGNTAALARLLAKELEPHHIETTIYDLYQHQIEPCSDCRKCKETKDLECIRQDGMSQLYPRMEEADVLIFGTPIYWFSPSAQTKLLIDRFRPYFVNKKLYGKKGALLLPAGSGPMDCDLTIEQFKRIFKALGITYLDAITATAYNEGDVDVDPHIHTFIRDLAHRITTN